MVLDLEINGITQTDRCIRSPENPKIMTAQDFDGIPASYLQYKISHVFGETIIAEVSGQ